MLPSLPPTDPDVPISSIRFLTGELRSRRSMTPSVTRLVEVSMSRSITQRSPVDSATPRLDLASSAIRCRFVYRSAGPKVPSCFPSTALSSRRLPSLDRVPARPVPRRPQYYEGATTSRTRIPSHLFVSLPGPTRFLIDSCSLSPALPSGLRSRVGPGSLFSRRSPCRRALAWTRSGCPRFPGDPSCAFAPVQDPGRTDDTSPRNGAVGAAPAPTEAKAPA